jgi:hypothetical protein
LKAEQSIIKRQAREINRLRRENARLRQIAYKSHRPTDTDDSAARLFSDICASQRAMEAESYTKYIYFGVKDSSAYSIWMRILTYFRRFRLASTIIRIATWIVTLIQSSALLIVSTAVFVVTVPLLIIASITMGIAALIHSTSLNRRFSALAQGKKIYVFFPSAAQRTVGYSVVRETAHQLAKNKNNLVFIVSPYNFSSYILGNKQPYMTSKSLSNNIYCIRKHYFFTLRKKVLSSPDEHTRYIF